MLLILLVVFNVCIWSVDCKNELYMGYKVYNIKLETKDQEDKLHLIKSDFVDFWRKPSLKYNITGQAMVPPTHSEWFEEKLQDLGIAKQIFLEDVYEHLSLRDENTENIHRFQEQQAFDFDDYYGYDEILNYTKALEEIYSNSTEINFDVIEAGNTAEGRPLIYVKMTQISTVIKPVVVIEAGIIPREWITIPSALTIVNKLLGDQRRLLESFEWIIIPVLNPDGYEYTRTNLRLWTKSRSTRSNLGAICPGVNINRNFDIDWLSSDSSSSPCSHLYAGVEPFSEIETRLVRSLLEEYGQRIGLYISLQNSGGFISYPWQYERAASGMFRQHHLLGLNMIAAMEDDYNLDVASLAYSGRASGTSSDYMRTGEVLYTFNIDIVQRGEDGVFVPKEEIRSIAEDVWRAVSVAANGIL